MDIIDNLKKLGKNWRLTALLVWMLVGIAIIPYPNRIVSIIGILIFLPFLVFLMFLFLLSLISKKNIFEYSPWKIIVFLLISLPIMLFISIILIVLLAISVVSYFFFTSWFILYGCYLLGKNIDTKLYKTPKLRPFIRTLIFFGGLAASLLFLYLFIIGPTLFDFSVIIETPIDVPWYLNGIYILVGGVLVGLAIVCIVYMFKKSFAGWFGTFAILVSIYTLFLILKIYLGIVDTEPDEIGSIWAYIAVIIPDLFIIFYSLSTLMGSQAELLSKRFKRFGLDAVIIWLILSKVTYEFIHYFPYDVFQEVNVPWLNALSTLDTNDLINLVKNVAVLIFFIALLVVIGIYEINKYAKEQKQLKVEVDLDVQELLAPQPILEEKHETKASDPSESIEDTEIYDKINDDNEDEVF
ncbi:MAG: hypothetical protein KAT57_03295 [Candidatus Lokiarchaeota archaeon]|nr:hypothetical protein [Candidatus Lokiarchaeota archaeon]